jgi:outer membrane receptor for Fe3+-dicitrate
MKTKRVIWLAATQRMIGLDVYVAGVKAAIAQPDATFKSGLTTWWPVTGAEIRTQFRRGMHHRINLAIPYNKIGSLP